MFWYWLMAKIEFLHALLWSLVWKTFGVKPYMYMYIVFLMYMYADVMCSSCVVCYTHLAL